MKFLLTAVNAKYIHSNPAIYSLRAYAGAELQEHIELAEYTINQHVQDILADIYRRKPDAIGFSCYIWNWNVIQDLIPELSKLLPDTDIWLGGPEVTYDAEWILKEYPQITGIMVGEGEATFKELLTYYVEKEARDRTNIRREVDGQTIVSGKNVANERNPVNMLGTENERNSVNMLGTVNEQNADNQLYMVSFSHIAGLCLPTGCISLREHIDMNELPFLYHDLQPFANRIIYYETSRGCPYRCSYCLSSIDKRVRLRDISVVKRELQFFLDNQVAQVKFVDRTFNCNHEHAMAIWQYIYEHDNGVTNFHFEISADILREDEIALLRKFRPGLAQLEIGVQSVNEQTIRAVNRVMNVEKLEKIVASIQAGQNIHQHLDLIAGLPYEDYASFAYSFDRVYAMRPEQLQLGFLKVLKGSEMQQRAEEFGICYLSKPPYEVLYTRWLSYEDILRLKQIEEMVEIYYNSNQYAHTLAFLQRAFSGPFVMFEAIADYYEREGFFVNGPARVYRYQLLLKFAEEYDGTNTAIYRELLTYDMYLRENLKSRPDFAADMTEEPIKNTVRAFYQREEKERKYLPAYAQYDWKQLSKMTHLEPFRFPVWDNKALEQCRMTGESVRTHEERTYEEPAYILFDYSSRNPLNYEAAAYPVETMHGNNS